jgi:AcrR family transcriptional regulator
MDVMEAAEGRRYDSSLRQAQVAQTRERILGGLVRTMARGVAELSFPAVAKEAGVSLRTVYRYFPTKRELLAGLIAYADARSGSVHEPRPRSPNELADQVRQAYLSARPGHLDGVRERILELLRETPFRGEDLMAIRELLESLVAKAVAVEERARQEDLGVGRRAQMRRVGSVWIEVKYIPDASSGREYGPYLYGRWREAGRKRSRYIGKAPS